MYELETLPVKASFHSASGTVVSGRHKVIGVYFNPSGVAGTIRLLDGGSGGSEILKIATPAIATRNSPLIIPGYLLFETDCYIELTNVTDATVFYD